MIAYRDYRATKLVTMPASDDNLRNDFRNSLGIHLESPHWQWHDYHDPQTGDFKLSLQRVRRVTVPY